MRLIYNNVKWAKWDLWDLYISELTQHKSYRAGSLKIGFRLAKQVFFREGGASVSCGAVFFSQRCSNLRSGGTAHGQELSRKSAWPLRIKPGRRSGIPLHVP